MNDKEREKNIKLFLIRIGIRCDFIGFEFLTQATRLVLKRPELLNSPKQLYKKVAEICKPEFPKRVGLNIQNAIDYTYEKRGFEGINKFFGEQIIDENHKPSPEELIWICAQYIRSGLYRKKIVIVNGSFTIKQAQIRSHA